MFYIFYIDKYSTKCQYILIKFPSRNCIIFRALSITNHSFPLLFLLFSFNLATVWQDVRCLSFNLHKEKFWIRLVDGINDEEGPLIIQSYMLEDTYLQVQLTVPCVERNKSSTFTFSTILHFITAQFVPFRSLGICSSGICSLTFFVCNDDGNLIKYNLQFGLLINLFLYVEQKFLQQLVIIVIIF